MSRAIVTSFHNYCPLGDGRYFQVLLDAYLKSFREIWGEEVDHLYLLDSNWGIQVDDPKITVIKTDPNVRYYDVYKSVLPQVQEDFVGFLDNDMVVYRKGVLEPIFGVLERREADVCSIYDTIGEQHFEELGGQSKFCPYFFFTRTQLLMLYLDCEWGPVMPKNETLGELTEKMLADHRIPYEIEEDKTVEGKNLGYYHVRAGSTVAYLLTTKYYGDPQTYWSYLKNQPESELLRHCDWYDKMGGDSSDIRKDLREKNAGTAH